MEIVTSWMRQGMVIGRQEGFIIGREEGRQEGELSLVLKLLTRRFGNIAEQTEIRVRNLSVTGLEALADAIFDFTSEADLVAWLDQYSQNN